MLISSTARRLKNYNSSLLFFWNHTVIVTTANKAIFICLNLLKHYNPIFSFTVKQSDYMLKTHSNLAYLKYWNQCLNHHCIFTKFCLSFIFKHPTWSIIWKQHVIACTQFDLLTSIQIILLAFLLSLLYLWYCHTNIFRGIREMFLNPKNLTSLFTRLCVYKDYQGNILR